MRCSRYYGQHTVPGLPPHSGRSSFPTPVCGDSARQFRQAYGASSAITGQGQTIAFVDEGLVPRMFRTLRLYAAHEGLPAPLARDYSEVKAVPGRICPASDVLPQSGRTNPLFRGIFCEARDCFQTSLNVADDENPRMPNYFGQVTLPGYDNMTGLGTPAGRRFVTVLRQLEK